MPLFYTPKPRQFQYRPRFYDPEKERWEALKQKYADEQMAKKGERNAHSLSEGEQNGEVDLEYFQRRVRELDRSERKKLTWKDAFRKREMPKWNYQPRFQSTEEESTGEHLSHFKKRGVNIKRRFDVSDTDYMKPIPAGRIMLYAFLVCALLYWILF